MMTTDPKKTLGLYIHIPFCIHKCDYCDFYSQTDYTLSDSFVRAVMKEAELYAPSFRGHTVNTVYIGGGTPTSLTSEQLDTLLSALNDFFSIEDAEITVEANPATLDHVKLKTMQKNGVNRLSLGLQSVCDVELKTISRIHSFEDFVMSYQLAKSYISNVSVDLIYGLPNQTSASFYRSLSTVIGLAPEHISLYALKVEEGTPLAKKEAQYTFATDDEVADMYLHACELLSQHGYIHYEISNFARQGCFSKHNIRYWKRQDYLGLGPSAHSLIQNRRFSHKRDIHDYVRCLDRGVLPDLSDDYTLSVKDCLEEEIMLSLRLTEGLSIPYLNHKYGYDMEKEAGKKIRDYVRNGFMNHNGSIISFTPRGFLVSNTILADLMPD